MRSGVLQERIGHLPRWAYIREELNASPLGHDNWGHCHLAIGLALSDLQP